MRGPILNGFSPNFCRKAGPHRRRYQSVNLLKNVFCSVSPCDNVKMLWFVSALCSRCGAE